MMDRDAYLPFLEEHTGLSRALIVRVLEANNLFWETQKVQWAHGEAWDDDTEPDGG